MPSEDSVRLGGSCQKVWLLLEEKQIPFKVSKINMRSYGDKPAWFTNLVPGGFLPVM